MLHCCLTSVALLHFRLQLPRLARTTPLPAPLLAFYVVFAITVTSLNVQSDRETVYRVASERRQLKEHFFWRAVLRVNPRRAPSRSRALASTVSSISLLSREPFSGKDSSLPHTRTAHSNGDARRSFYLHWRREQALNTALNCIARPGKAALCFLYPASQQAVYQIRSALCLPSRQSN